MTNSTERTVPTIDFLTSIPAKVAAEGASTGVGAISRLSAPASATSVVSDADPPEAAPPTAPGTTYRGYHDEQSGISVRDLGGRRWRVVHQTWPPGDLVKRLDQRE